MSGCLSLKTLIVSEKMVDLKGHFSNPEGLIEALEEMEEVLTQGQRSQTSKPEP